jgi:hypothetical protein
MKKRIWIFGILICLALLIIGCKPGGEAVAGTRQSRGIAMPESAQVYMQPEQVYVPGEVVQVPEFPEGEVMPRAGIGPAVNLENDIDAFVKKLDDLINEAEDLKAKLLEDKKDGADQAPKTCMCNYEAKTVHCWPKAGEILERKPSGRDYDFPAGTSVLCEDMRSGFLGPWCNKIRIVLNPPISTKLSANVPCKTQENCKTATQSICAVAKPILPNQSPQEKEIAGKVYCQTDAAGTPSDCLCMADWQIKDCTCE